MVKYYLLVHLKAGYLYYKAIFLLQKGVAL
jgi:hypothetical protein